MIGGEMEKVVVACATQTGSMAEVAAEIVKVLGAKGHSAEVKPIAEAEELAASFC